MSYELKSNDQETLISQIRSGSVEALAEYIQLVRPQLTAYVEKELGAGLRKKIEADDILQELSADAVRSLPEMNLAEREPFSWLCQIAQRRIIDAHRRFFAQKRDAGKEVPLAAGGGNSGEEGGGLLHLLAASITSPSAAFSRNVREQRLHAAILELSSTQQTALRLRYVEGLPSKEIAEQIGKTDAAVRVLLTRTLRKLQEILGSAN